MAGAVTNESVEEKLNDLSLSNDDTSKESRQFPNDTSKESRQFPCILVLGMAGSGKTTFVQRLTAHLNEKKTPAYVLNLDPAVHQVPYPTNIDIRDTVKYKEVMKQYNLGPNGGIMTCLNLFATKFDQVLNFAEKNANKYSCMVLDTPGQIEVFTWSASGAIITESLASTFPTIIVYVMDTARCTNPVTFMSNMLYACSIMYKTKLPFIVLLNKVDIVDHSFIEEWMNDFEAFQDAVSSETSYMSNLTRSMSFVLDEFYQNLKTVGVSSMTGFGMDKFMIAVQEGIQEYYKEYKPELEKKILEKETKAQATSPSSTKFSAFDGSMFTTPVRYDVPFENGPVINPANEDYLENNYDDRADENEEIKENESFNRFLKSQKPT